MQLLCCEYSDWSWSCDTMWSCIWISAFLEEIATFVFRVKWRWRQQIHFKHCCPLTRLHGVTIERRPWCEWCVLLWNSVFEDMCKNHKFCHKSVVSVWYMQVIKKHNINKGVWYLKVYCRYMFRHMEYLQGSSENLKSHLCSVLSHMKTLQCSFHSVGK